MALSIFDDKSKPPSDEQVVNTLGKTAAFWHGLKAHLSKEFDEIIEEWKFYGKSAGWCLVLKHGKRTILYLSPLKNSFLVIFVFGDKAVKASQESDLPQAIISSINNAKKYVEGRSFRIEVNNKRDIEIVKKLVSIKMSN